MVYIMNGNKQQEAPSPQYYLTIEEGYIENGLDTSYLETALDEAINFELKNDVQMEFGV